MLAGLKEGARGSAGTAWRRLRANLVIFEVAIAMVLLTGAGLLGKSLYLLLHLDLGFQPDHLARVQLSWAPGRYNKDEQKIQLARQIVDQVSKLPGVQSVGLSLAPPINSAWGTASFHIAGRPNRGEDNEVLGRQVTSRYFPALRAQILRGRAFREDDGSPQPLVAVVNRTLANRYFPGRDAIGQQIYYDWRPKSPMQIVGVIADIQEGPLGGAAWPALYVPYNQNPCAWPALLARTSQPPAALLPEIARAVHQVDPYISVSEEETMIERVDHSPAAYLHLSSAVLAGAFAASALLLSVVGLYGVVAYAVSQRTREIGIRIALGAGRPRIYRLILGETGRMLAYGFAWGLTASLATAALLRSLLFGVHSWDVPTLAAVAALLALASLLATYLPARRAARLNPLVALREE